MGIFSLRHGEAGVLYQFDQKPDGSRDLYLVNFSMLDLPRNAAGELLGTSLKVIVVDRALDECGHGSGKALSICLMGPTQGGVSFIRPDPETGELLGGWFLDWMRDGAQPDTWYWLKIGQASDAHGRDHKWTTEPSMVLQSPADDCCRHGIRYDAACDGCDRRGGLVTKKEEGLPMHVQADKGVCRHGVGIDARCKECGRG